MTRRAWALVPALIAIAGCDDDGSDPITAIGGPRLLAITAEPPALAVDGELALTIFAVGPDGPAEADEVRLRACAPWRIVSDPARDCPIERAVPLEVDDAGRGIVSATALAAAFPSPSGAPAPAEAWQAALAAGLSLRVPIIAEVVVDGEILVARRHLDVVAPDAVGRNPVLAEVRFDGVPATRLRAGQRYQLTASFDAASLDAPPDDDAEHLREQIATHFYSPDGELDAAAAALDDPDADSPASEAITFTAGARGESWIFVVGLDETGGVTTASIPVSIEDTDEPAR